MQLPGLSEPVIGLTIMAAGTGALEVALSVMSARAGGRTRQSGT